MSIADRITSMSNNLSSAYDGIEYLGVDTTGVDKNLQNLSSMLNVVYEGLPKVSDEGVSPSIDGSRVGRLKSTLKSSNITQESTTGYNILPITLESGTYNGLQVTKNSDGSITFNGTPTSNLNLAIFSEPVSGLTLNGDYTFYLIGKKAYINLQGNIDGTTVAFLTYSSTSEAAVKSYDTNVTLYSIFSYLTTQNTFNNETFYYMVIKGNDKTKPYEPYTGGIPSPNPDYPQDIHTIKGNNTVEVCGKNLWSSEWEQGGISNSNGQNTTSSVSVRTKGYISVQPNQHYSIQRSIATDYIMVRGYSKNKTFLGTGNDVLDLIYGQTSGNPMRTGDSNCIISPKEGVYYLRIVENSNDLSTQYMMVKGDYQSGLVYEQYTGTTYPINLGDIELCKISTYQDKLFKAVSGDTVYDSLTSEQKEGLISGGWYKYGKIKKVVFNGNESWGKSGNTNNNIFYIQGEFFYLTTENINLYSNYFIGKVIWNKDEIGAELYPTNSFRIGLGLSSSITTVEQFKTWLSTHNTTVYYVLATPTITQITDTTLISQLENLYKAMSKNGQTNILQTNTDVPFTIFASALKGA